VTSAHGTSLASTLSYTYDGLGRTLSETDPLGNVTAYEYDAVGQVLTRTMPLGNVTTYEYDQVGHRVLERDGNGHATQYEYDDMDRLVRTIAPDGTSLRYTYDDAGRMVDTIDQLGRVTRRDYDLAGRLIGTTRAYGTGDASTTSYQYDPAGRRVGVTDPLNNVTTYVYDEANRLAQTIDPLGYETTREYDAAGQLVSVTDANDSQTTYAYDELGRLVDTIYADGTTSSLEYACSGRLSSTTDQAGRTTGYSYDDAGRLAAIGDPLGNTTEYGYDLAGNLTSVTDANGHTTSFSYDALGRRERKTWPDGSYEAFSYDRVGNLLSHTLADGNVNSFSYDAMDRLELATHFDGQTLAYEYTDTGMRETVTDGRGATSYAYDALERVIQITQPGGAQVAYDYDAAGNRTSLTTPAGMTTYGYDELDQLTSVVDPQGGETTLTYDAVGLRTQKSLPNGISVDYGYDELNRLTSIVQHDGTNVLESYEYELGPAGSRLSVTNEDGASVHWSYDDDSRLIGEEFRDASGIPVTQTSYSYDAVGNRLSETVNGVTTDYTYDELDQLLSRGSVQYSYDGRGNLVQVADGVDVTAYTWDALDRLSTISGAGLAASYEYDADGRRVQSTVGMEVTNYLWDELSQCGDVVLEMDGSGALLASYVLAGPELISQRRAGSTSYYLHDAQGSVRALTDLAGAITDQYTYAAFGELLEEEGGTENPYRYTGQQYDEASGLYSLRARYYDPAAGRFLSRDPLEQWRNVREVNRYSYAANDPVNLADASGRQALAEGALLRAVNAGVTGAVAGFVGGFVYGATFMVLIALELCSAEDKERYGSMSAGDMLFYAFLMGLAGAAVGGVVGFGLSLGTSALLAQAGTIAQAVAWSRNVKTGLLLLGGGLTLYKILKDKSICTTLPLILSIVAGWLAAQAAQKWLLPRLPWNRPAARVSGAPGADDGDDFGRPRVEGSRLRPEHIRNPDADTVSLGSRPEYVETGRDRGWTHLEMPDPLWNQPSNDDFIVRQIEQLKIFQITLGPGKPVGPGLQSEIDLILGSGLYWGSVEAGGFWPYPSSF
jgi:RHS repeat-associated protein